MGPSRASGVHIVSYKAIRLFCARYPEAKAPLDRWYEVTEGALWANFVDVRQTFNTADFVAPHVVFDIGGNKFRLIAEINFRKKALFVRHIMTHKEYERGVWKR